MFFNTCIQWYGAEKLQQKPTNSSSDDSNHSSEPVAPKNVYYGRLMNIARMSDDGHSQPPSPQQPDPVSSGSQPNPQFPDVQPVEEPTSRSLLLERARNFLYSPQVRYEDSAAKYKFLADKGLDDAEIRGLLQELVSNIYYCII